MKKVLFIAISIALSFSLNSCGNSSSQSSSNTSSQEYHSHSYKSPLQAYHDGDIWLGMTYEQCKAVCGRPLRAVGDVHSGNGSAYYPNDVILRFYDGELGKVEDQSW